MDAHVLERERLTLLTTVTNGLTFRANGREVNSFQDVDCSGRNACTGKVGAPTSRRPGCVALWVFSARGRVAAVQQGGINVERARHHALE